MFIGHFAVGLASKKVAPRASLAVLLAAPLLADLLWPPFLLLGWEHMRIAPGDTRFTPFDLYDYLWSHSLLMLAVWATVFAAVYLWLSRDGRAAAVIWCGVLSHWVLDWITHRPDMPLYPGGPQYGLALWNSVAGTMVTELAMFAAAVGIYKWATKPRDRIGRYGLWIYAAVLVALYVGNRFSALPGSVQEVAWTGIAGSVVLLAFAWWFDAHRQAVASIPAPR